jgi:predicted SprT family Zn-dependent metalloprotease
MDVITMDSCRSSAHKKKKIHASSQPTLDWTKETNVDATLTFEELFDYAKEALSEGMQLARIRREVKIEWRNYPVTAGMAYYPNVIRLSKKILKTKKQIRETVLHEYAHLVVYDKWGDRAMPHGEEWREVMLLFGLNPQVTHDYECHRRTIKKPYVCRCQRCGYEIRRSKPLMRNRIYTHIGCGGKMFQSKSREKHEDS